jgi:hypothetical protein
MGLMQHPNSDGATQHKQGEGIGPGAHVGSHRCKASSVASPNFIVLERETKDTFAAAKSEPSRNRLRWMSGSPPRAGIEAS